MMTEPAEQRFSVAFAVAWMLGVWALAIIGTSLGEIALLVTIEAALLIMLVAARAFDVR